ncbi:hypothetical protein DL93DRAFT_2076929 [Clavulina sp. PMI_390]|nr:hypothetical protein DL93DRAFT_2076929 [Clavulina sp. PMI_390]
MSSNNVWHCDICNWEVRQGDGFEPIVPYGAPAGGYMPPPGPGYGGSYGPPQGQPQMHPPPVAYGTRP